MTFKKLIIFAVAAALIVWLAPLANFYLAFFIAWLQR